MCIWPIRGDPIPDVHMHIFICQCLYFVKKVKNQKIHKNTLLKNWIHVYIHIYTSLYMHICLHAYTQIFWYRYIYMYINAYTHICIHIHICISEQPSNLSVNIIFKKTHWCIIVHTTDNFDHIFLIRLTYKYIHVCKCIHPYIHMNPNKCAQCLLIHIYIHIYKYI
jgi:ferredoxin